MRALLPVYVHVRCVLFRARRRLLPDERGEGVISAALAVLIMAFLGALMWAVFKDLFTDTTSRTKGQVDLIGR